MNTPSINTIRKIQDLSYSWSRKVVLCDETDPIIKEYLAKRRELLFNVDHDTYKKIEKDLKDEYFAKYVAKNWLNE